MALTAKQERFCQEYMIDFNATQAAIRAGYSEKTAYSIGEENLRKPEIANVIDSKKEEARARAELTADMVINELRTLGFWNIQDFLEEDNQIKLLKSLPRNKTIPVIGIKVKVATVDGVAEVTTELKMSDKRGALVDLGRHLGIFEKDNEQGKTVIKVTRK